MNDEEKKRIILDFTKKHTLAVLATTNADGKPEASTMEFSENEDLELIFDTFENFRKYRNLQSNPHVAMVIGSGDKAVQYEGKAVELSGDELTKAVEIHITKLPDAEKFTKMKGIKFFKVIPRWIRYTDVSKQPWEEFEITF